MSNLIEELKQAIANGNESIQSKKNEQCSQSISALQLKADIIAKMEDALNYTKGKLLEAYLSKPHISRMICIAELQDELVNLGFLFRKFHNSVERSIDQLQYNYIVVTFPLEYVVIHNKLTGEDFYYNYADPELHTNVLSKVKQFKGG